MRIEQFIEETNRATSVDELFALYKKAMASAGFDRLIFSLMTDHAFINRSAGHGIMLNYSEDWMKYYAEKNYEATDPVRRQMFSAPGGFFWDDVTYSPKSTRAQVKLMHEGADAGLRDGVGIPLRGPGGALAGVGAASSAGGVEVNQNMLSYVNLLSQQFYTVFLNLEQKESGGVVEMIALSDREQEILKWVARGKTKWEIGQILCLSEHTVDFHVRNVLRKMNANNITLAVLKALHMGLIQL